MDTPGKILIISLMLLILQFKSSNAQYKCFNANGMTVPYLGLGASQFWNAKSQDLEQCAKLCVRRKLCASITYDIQSGMCELNAGTRADTPTRVGTTLLYSEFQWWPASLDKSCYSRPCRDNEVCIPGGLANGSPDCSYFCMTAGREVCPLPPWGVSNGRTVGSVNIYTCGKGTVGGGSATCLPSKEWDKKIDTTCTPILAHPCKNDSLCSEINGYCSAKGQCECEPSKIYDETSKECVVECADGWEKFGVHCYLFNNDPLSWEKAKIHCTQLGSNLLKVEDAPEHEFAKAKCAEYGTIYYWIGARWSTEYGEYRWYDDTVMNYTVWSPGEPDIKRGCVDMLVSVDWAWNSHHDCSNTNGSSICEKG